MSDIILPVALIVSSLINIYLSHTISRLRKEREILMNDISKLLSDMLKMQVEFEDENPCRSNQ